MKLIIAGGRDFRYIVRAFDDLESFERVVTEVVSPCPVGAEWAHYFKKPIADGPADAMVVLWDGSFEIPSKTGLQVTIFTYDCDELI